MHKPLIGITCGEIQNRIEPWSPVTHGQSQTYIQAILRAGGTPILLPLTTDPSVTKQLSELIDGLCMAGGNDLNPHLYGQEPLPTTADYSDMRDQTETNMVAAVMSLQKPVLAICRGMQLLNVYRGGTLHQDLSVITSVDHDASSKLRSLVDASYPLSIVGNSKLAGIIGDEPINTNEHHHQAIDTLGKGVVVTARSGDNIIEGIELINYPYAIGIQSHPESLVDVEPRWQTLFRSFVEHARKNATAP